MKPFVFRLYSHDAYMHDLLCGKQGDFQNLVSEFDTDSPAKNTAGIEVPVLVRNMGTLVPTARFAASLLGEDVDLEGVGLIPETAADMRSAVDRHIEQVNQRLQGTRVSLLPPEDAIYDVISRLQGAIGYESDEDILRLFGVLTGGLYVGPRVFHVDVSNACNSDCVYCWFHSPYSKNRSDAHLFDEAWRRQMLDFDIYRSLIDDLAALHTTEDIVLSGKGEPLTHPRIMDMVRYAKSKGMFVTLFTNGILLDRELCEVLVESRLDLLYVSLSAASNEVYAALHTDPPDGEFDSIVENLRRLVAVKEERGSSLPELVMVSIINNRNYKDVAAFADLAASVGTDHLRYQLTAIEHYNRELRLEPDQLEELKGLVETAVQKAEQAGIKVISNIDFQLAKVAESGDWSGEYFLEKGCLAGWMFSRVWADGRISFCCVPKPIASIQERGFRELWESDEYHRVRMAGLHIRDRGDLRFMDGSRLLDERCARCPNYEQIQFLLDLADRLHVAEFIR